MTQYSKSLTSDSVTLFNDSRTGISLGGQADPFDATGISDILFGLNCSANTSPGSILMAVQGQGPDGVWQNVTPTLTVSGVASGCLRASGPFPDQLRVAWAMDNEMNADFTFWVIGRA